MEAPLRFEWGEDGLAAALPDVDTVVVVDVLSFCTAVDVAVAAGASVRPWRWKDASAGDEAARVGAHLAVGRSQVDDRQPFSLSPPTMAGLRPGDRLVLPSPNGATLAAMADEAGRTVVAACLRNAGAVARWLAPRAGAVVVVAAGERWPSGTLRPALEDLLGSGAVLSALGTGGTPDARAAAAAFDAVRPNLADTIWQCASGRELLDAGYPDDVATAVGVDASHVVPLLRDGWFVDGA